jgi:hypothetical protein
MPAESTAVPRRSDRLATSRLDSARDDDRVTRSAARVRGLAPILALLVFAVAACTIGDVSVLGGRQGCWDEGEQLVASLMKGTLDVGGANPTLTTPEGEVLPLRLARFDLANDGARPAIISPTGGPVLAVDGDFVTLFGGLGTDGSMYVCGVEARAPGS